ncbi:hypothetical protein [Microlunatus sagamiharensis]|nr:hypothetical protein [Microlunatus sagamiharensis]
MMLVLGLVMIALAGVAIAAHSGRAGFGAALILVALILGARSKPTRLAFPVGSAETHEVVFSFDKFWGNLSVTVDGVPAVRDLRTVSVSLTKTYCFSVGVHERHEVRIEKDRALLLAGARRQPVRAYVDGVLAAETVA